MHKGQVLRVYPHHQPTAALPEGKLPKSFKLSSTTPRGRVAFGTVRIYPRELMGDETIDYELEPMIRDLN